MRWAGNVARMGLMRSVYKVLVGRPGCRWEDDIRMDHREIVWQSVVSSSSW